MAPTVQMMTGKKYAPVLRKLRSGNEARVNYWVSNVLGHVAINAPGIPEIGDAFGSSLPGAYVKQIIPHPEDGGGGVQETDGGYNEDQNGWCRVEVVYGPLEDTGITPDLSSWTRVRVGGRSVRAMYPLDASTGLPEVGSQKLANGDGVQIYTGQVEAEVHTFHTGSVNTSLLATVINLAKPCKLNDAGLSLPRVGGPTSSSTMPLGPGQALYMGFDLNEVSPGVIELMHRLVLSKDFVSRTAVEDENGDCASVATEIVYEEDSFAGLWA